MKTMRGFKGLLKRDSSLQDLARGSHAAGTTEVQVVQAVRRFCEMNRVGNNDGDEVLQLPVIVDGAESSPAAAERAAQQIREFLGKEYLAKPHIPYNAIMLLRILADHPGPAFTKYFDANFVTAVKKLNMKCNNASVLQILHETLDSLQITRAEDEGCRKLLQMWKKEKETNWSTIRNPYGQLMRPSQYGANGQAGPQPSNTTSTLPPPVEMASRLEEARNTAKILTQLVQSTPAEEFAQAGLPYEFYVRCQTAQRSVQGYINAINPSPDHDTMQTLIEVNERLGVAASAYQRGLLAARRAVSTTSVPQSGSHSQQHPPRADSRSPATPEATTTGSQDIYSAFAPAPLNAATTEQHTSSAFLSRNNTTASSRPSAVSAEEEDTANAPLINPFSDPDDHVSTAHRNGTTNGNGLYAWSAHPTSTDPSPEELRQRQAFLENAYSDFEPVVAAAATTSAAQPLRLGNAATETHETRVPEIDGHSQVGRKDREPEPRQGPMAVWRE